MSTKTVWITGASSGIGREFARRYARLGFRLILTARRRDRLETLAAELRAKHGTLCRIVPADLEQDAQVTALCEALADERIDLFINNAGFGACGAFSETDEGKELSMLRVNVLAMHRLFKFTLRKMEAQGYRHHPERGILGGPAAGRALYGGLLRLQGIRCQPDPRRG